MQIGEMTSELFTGSAKCLDFTNVPKNTRDYVSPEAVRSAVEGDSLVCSLRQTKSRPVSGRPMGHSEKTRLAVKEQGTLADRIIESALIAQLFD